MKKLISFSALAVMAMTLVFTSCSEDDEKQSTHPASITGTWSHVNASTGYSYDLIITDAVMQSGVYTRFTVAAPGEQSNNTTYIGGTIYDAKTGTATVAFEKAPDSAKGTITVKSETELTIKITSENLANPIEVNLKKVSFPLSINGTWAGNAIKKPTVKVLFNIHPTLVSGKLEGEMTVHESQYPITEITYDAKTGKVTFEYNIAVEVITGTMQYDYKSDKLKGSFDVDADYDVDDFELEQAATGM